MAESYWKNQQIHLRHLTRYLGSLVEQPCHRITQATLEDYLRERLKTRDPETVKRERVALIQFYKWIASRTDIPACRDTAAVLLEMLGFPRRSGWVSARSTPHLPAWGRQRCDRRPDGNQVIPHGLYDVGRNVGHLTLGISHDTSQFACDSLSQWWQRCGSKAYPEAESMLLLCDSGGSNNYRHYIFKENMQRPVNKLLPTFALAMRLVTAG